MSKCWQRSGLKVGEEVRLPERICTSIVSRLESSRLLSATYIGETSAGMLFELKFMPAFGTTEPEMWHYRVIVDFAAVYCGQVKIVGEYLGEVVAKRKTAGV